MAQTTTRNYPGSLPDATTAYQRDAVTMAQSGWYPTAQTYAPGSWGAGAFLVALLLCIVLVGFLVFVYLIVVKPAGTLLVTYEYRPGEAPSGAVPPPLTPLVGDGWARL
ncbi:MAG: hypothetical protein WAN48_11400 [Actinomycetes bacterium]